MRRAYKHITYDKRRSFAGTALPYTNGTGLLEIQDFKDQGYLSPRSTSVYYSDASDRNRREVLGGILTSAIAYRDGSDWETDAVALPRYSGETGDAELYALKMAFDIAVRHAHVPERCLENIVFFTDCRDVVEMLTGNTHWGTYLGPVPTEGRWALEDIFDAADHLKAVGTTIVVAWIKAHKYGFGREGNHKADKAAEVEMDKQCALLHNAEEKLDEFPGWAQGLEGDIREEALWRLSKPFFRWGLGRCWVAPTLQDGNGCVTVETSDDWTIYRAVPTLREAQEDDVHELRRYMAKKFVKDRPYLPKKMPTRHDQQSRATPLKHLWRHAKVLVKPPKGFNYAKLYRKVQERCNSTSQQGT